MPRSDYDHWNEEADQVWWAEEGRHDDAGPPYCDICGFSHFGNCEEEYDDDDS